MGKIFLLAGTFNAALCVVLGAFAAHKLKGTLPEHSLATFQTGVQYHFYHSFALILLALLILNLNIQSTYFKYAGIGFLSGILLFSGSLYGLALFGWRFLGPITPIGGLAFIVAWLLMCFGVYKHL